MTPEKRELLWRKAVKDAGAREDTYGPRLTMNPAKASVIVLPHRKLKPEDKEFHKWQKRLNC